MELQPIKKEELIFYKNLVDRTCTHLKLDDYQWMDYKLETSFKTKELGKLKITFQYFGSTESAMEIDQYLSIVSNIAIHHSYRFPTDIFKKHICRYMKAHIDSWDEEYAFDGENYVLDFYNEVINYIKENEDK